MNNADFANPNRGLAVPAVVMATVATWFVLATGAVVADMASPIAVPAAVEQVTLLPEGAMKLTVVAQRPQAGRVHTAALRQPFHG